MNAAVSSSLTPNYPVVVWNRFEIFLWFTLLVKMGPDHKKKGRP